MEETNFGRDGFVGEVAREGGEDVAGPLGVGEECTDR